MAKRQKNTVKVWAPDGKRTEMQTPDNARDLILHAGWFRENPNITAKEAAEAKADIEAGGNAATMTYAEAEKSINAVRDDGEQSEEKKSAKKDDKPKKDGKPKKN